MWRGLLWLSVWGLGSAAQAATVGYWTFSADGKSAGDVADVIVDQAGVVNGSVTTGGPVYSADMPPFASGTSLVFDGDDRIDLASEATFDFDANDPFTLEAWLKTSVTTGHLNLVVKLLPAEPFTGFQWIVDAAGGGALMVALQHDNSPLTSLLVGGTTAVNDGQWHHVAVTYDGSGTAAGLQLYVDHVADAVTVLSNNLGTSSTLNNQPLMIGRDPRNINGMVGSLAHVRVSDVVLSTSQMVSFAPPVFAEGVPTLPVWAALWMLGGLGAAGVQVLRSGEERVG
jgi:hypothetical protein